MAKQTEITLLNEEQEKSIMVATPAKYIKNRAGRGGKTFSYVEVGYVIQVLNKTFGYFWDWEIDEQHSGDNQVWVKGRLTIKNPSGFSVAKTAFGGSDIKKTANGQVIDIADDLKAASADALKKAASMIGIASDVYYPQLDRLDDELATEEKPKAVAHDVKGGPVCEEEGCGKPQVPVVVDYSRKWYGMVLCRDHQQNHERLNG